MPLGGTGLCRDWGRAHADCSGRLNRKTGSEIVTLAETIYSAASATHLQANLEVHPAATIRRLSDRVSDDRGLATGTAGGQPVLGDHGIPDRRAEFEPARACLPRAGEPPTRLAATTAPPSASPAPMRTAHPASRHHPAGAVPLGRSAATDGMSVSASGPNTSAEPAPESTPITCPAPAARRAYGNGQEHIRRGFERQSIVATGLLADGRPSAARVAR
jgi:hypothetical protein